MSQVYVITGTSRGIGLEYVKQLSEQDGNVIYAGARNPEGSEELMALVDNKKVFAFTIDVTSKESIEKAAAKVSETAKGIDVLINNAGVACSLEQNVFTATREEYARVFDTNVGSVSDVTQAFLPLLRQSSGKKIVNISSIMGSMDASIKEDSTGMVSPYRVSKGALNVLMSIFASALAAESFTVVSLHPGWVRTSMGGKNGQLDPPESVRYQIETIGKLTTADNGRFVSYDGKAIPW